MDTLAEQVQTMREGVTLTIARSRKRITDRLMTLDTALRGAAGDAADYQRVLGLNVNKLRAEIDALAVKLGELSR